MKDPDDLPDPSGSQTMTDTHAPLPWWWSLIIIAYILASATLIAYLTIYALGYHP